MIKSFRLSAPVRRLASRMLACGIAMVCASGTAWSAATVTPGVELSQWRDDVWGLWSVVLLLAAAVLLGVLMLRAARGGRSGRGRSVQRWLGDVEAAGHGVWRWDVASDRVACSPRFNAMLGAGARALDTTRAHLLALVHAADHDTLCAALEECRRGKEPMMSLRLRLRAADGEWRPLLLCGLGIEHDWQGMPRQLIGTVSEVIGPQTAQRQLEESEARSRAIINSAMDAIITVDEAQRIIEFNPAAEQILGCSAAEAISQPLERLIPERFRSAHRHHLERFGTTGVTMRRMGTNSVLYGLRADGTEFPVDASISRIDVGGRRFFTVILRDVTERERAAQALDRSHRELGELYSAMHDVREAERTRIARELHDELAQWLTALKMDVSWLAMKLPTDQAQLIAKTGKMKALVDTTVASVRRIAADLRPPMLDDLGVVAAVENLVHEFSERIGVMVSLDVNFDGHELHDPLATALYRMMQEALTNVARHSGASQVEVAMRIEEGVLRVGIRDNGCGIGNAEAPQKSFGVMGIRERARTLGGAAQVYSPESGGTVVSIEIPMAKHVNAGAAA